MPSRNDGVYFLGASLVFVAVAMCLRGRSLSPTSAPTPPAPVAVSPADRLVQAIIAVESAGSPDAEGMDGEVSILQIRPIMVEEVNRILGHAKYTEADRMDPEKSEEMFWIYTDFWANVFDDRSHEGIARRWNGGPYGHTKPSTLRYWDAVSARYWGVDQD